MAELSRGSKVRVRLPKGTKEGEVHDIRPGFYLCRFEDGSGGWVDAREVVLSEPPPPAPYSVPPPASSAPSPYSGSGYGPPASVEPPFQRFSPPVPEYAPPFQHFAPSSAPGEYACSACGRGGADHFPPGGKPLHRACAGLAPDELAWPWLLFAYGVVLPFGCSLVGAIIASIPYYVWRKDYPLRAKAYNRHVWFGFFGSIAFWISLGILTALVAPSKP